MSFPKKFLFVPVGWRDLGKVYPKYSFENGISYTTKQTHKFCGRDIRIGIENGEAFKFCSFCMCKTDIEVNQ